MHFQLKQKRKRKMDIVNDRKRKSVLGLHVTIRYDIHLMTSLQARQNTIERQFFKFLVPSPFYRALVDSFRLRFTTETRTHFRPNAENRPEMKIFTFSVHVSYRRERNSVDLYNVHIISSYQGNQ